MDPTYGALGEIICPNKVLKKLSSVNGWFLGNQFLTVIRTGIWPSKFGMYTR